MGSGITEALVPPFSFDDCIEQVLECRGETSEESGAGDLSVVFPDFLGGVLPLAGGSIVEFDLSSWNLSVDEDVNTLVAKRLSDLSDLTLTDSLESITEFRTALNREFFKMREFNILESKTSISPPKIFLSYLQGDDSHLDDSKSSPTITRICKFKHIPYTAFKIALEEVVPEEATDNDFGNAIGCSGKTFRELLSIAEEPSKDDVIDLVLELFSSFNIDESEIVKLRGPATEGGYYTILDKKLYVKMPDITARDSAGFYTDLFDDESNFYMEASKGRKSYGRSKFDSIAVPILATVDDADIPLPDSGNIEITIDTASAPGDITNAYLSILSSGETVDASKRSVKYHSDNLEVFSIPMLTVNDYFPGRKSTLEFDLSTKVDMLGTYFKEDAGLNSATSEETGVPFVGGVFDGEAFFGEKNRAEVLLADPNKPKSVRKNDRRYFSPKACGTLPLLTNVRPKLVQTVPSTWIEMNGANSGSEDDKVVLSFSVSSFNSINFDALKNEARFSLYLKDNYGQIFKAAGENVVISTGLPTIKSISPNGYKGSEEILSDAEGFTFRFNGEGLTSAIGLNVTIKGTDSGNDYMFSDEQLHYTGSSTLSHLKIDGQLSTIGLEPGQEYEFSFISVSGERGNSKSIYVSTAAGEELITRSKELVKFKSNEFSVRRFSSGFVSEIPILTDSHATISLKSRQRIFSGDLDVFAYIGITDESVAKAIGGDDVIEVSAHGSTFYVPFNVEYEFSKASDGDFSGGFFDSRANLSFPGTAYEKYNFFPLINAPIGSAFIFYNKRIVEDASGGKVTPDEGDFSVVWLGDPDGRKPFVLGPTILGLIADLPGEEDYTSTFVVEENEIDIRESFADKKFKPGQITMFQKISKLGIVFSSNQGSNLRRQLSFYVGSKKLSNLSERIKDLGDGRFLATFKNVTISEEGVLEVRIEKKDKTFKYQSEGSISKRASFPIAESEYTYNQDDGELTLTENLSNFYVQGSVGGTDFIADSSPVDLMIPGNNSGVLLNPKTSTIADHKFLYPLTIKPNISTEVVSERELTTLTGSITTELSEIGRTLMVARSGETLTGKSFSVSETGSAIGYLNWDLTNAATIKCNVPEIELIYPTLESSKGVAPDEIDGSLLKAGSEIKIRVRNTKKNFKVVFNELFSAKTKGPPRKISRGVYEAEILVPSQVVGSDCIDLCVSTVNSKRLGAKLQMGDRFVRNIGKNMEDKLFGNMKQNLPEVGDLHDLIKDFPLRFTSVKLEKSLVPTDLINSFCDFSWHLTADLKVALNGFQVLLIPIQVIFCIIDVICALLHPVKLARAVIRLFYCLYDLITLIPQISVPIMFLHTVLHLLKLLECVLLKVVEIVTAINEIIKAMELAVKQELWAALKTIEEVLSEYLLELKIDLDVFEPVISVHAIFIEILKLIFRLPCPPDDGLGDKSCGISGSMLAGIVAGKVSPGDGEYDPSVLLPVAQYYTDDEIEDVISTGSTYEEYTLGDELIDRGTEETYYDAMEIDPNSLRTTNGTDFEASFATSFTKSSKGLGEPTLVRFRFKDKLDNSGIFGKKVLDPLLNRDAPFHLLEEDSGALKIATDKGNFVSPIDGETFITKDGDYGSVGPLSLVFEFPIMEPNEETGMLEEVGIEEVPRTFDDIPKLTIVDEEANLYFIEPNGIKFNSNGDVEEIIARIVNAVSAPRLRFSREDQDVDTDGDDIVDDEGRVFDLPQLFFVDMRSIADELQSACYATSYNEFLLEEDETGDADDIIEIVEDSNDCVEEYRTIINNMIDEIRESLENGEVPSTMDLDAIAQAHQDMIDCLNEQSDKICRFVMNPLNSSFLIEEDTDETPLESFPEEIFDPVEFGPTTIEQEGPAFTGAREYAGGIGDSHVLGVGEVATIRVTPRDSYDLEMPGDLSEKISVNIISDTTGSAKILENEDGTTVSKEGSDYYVRIRSNGEGEVKLSATVCDRTIQAVTYAGVVDSLNTEEDEDCVPKSPEDDEAATRPGALIKIDRILTLYYVRLVTTAVVEPDDAVTGTPQVAGTALEN